MGRDGAAIRHLVVRVNVISRIHNFCRIEIGSIEEAVVCFADKVMAFQESIRSVDRPLF